MKPRSRIFSFTACALLIACGSDLEPTSDGAGGSTGPGGGGGGANAGGAGGIGPEGGSMMLHPGSLVDDGLVARYYLDEADSGQTPTEAIDAAPNPLNLALRYVGDPAAMEPAMTYIEDMSGNRGLNFSQVGMDDVAYVAIDTTKIATMLQGGTTLTYEIVADIQGVSSSTSRLSHIGTNGDHTFTFSASQLTHVHLTVNNQSGFDAPALLGSLGRAVYHAVFDSNEVEPADRVRFYVNGSPLPTLTVSSSLSQGTVIDLDVGKFYAIANREEGARTFEGTMYYSAIYNVALTSEQIIQNTGLLLVDDDLPSVER